MNPQSRGEITLASSDPLAKPIINPRFLDNPYDRLVFRKAINEGLKWTQAPSLKKFIKKPILIPASDSDEDVKVIKKLYAVALARPVLNPML